MSPDGILCGGWVVQKGMAIICSKTMRGEAIRRLKYAGGVTLGGGQSQVAGTKGANEESQCVDSESEQPFPQETENLGKEKGRWLEGHQG